MRITRGGRKRSLLRAFALLALAAAPLSAQDDARQVVDGRADVSVKTPAYAIGKGPVIAFDQAHRDRHGADSGYRPTALVAQNDGYRVARIAGSLTADALRPVGVLVIANARVTTRVCDGQPSGFTAVEIAAIHAWVEGGGALMLIADHMPYGAAAEPLAASFGFHFENSFAREGGRDRRERFATGNKRLLDSPLTRGDPAHGPVSEVYSFTGTVLHAPAGAIPVMRLGSGWQIVSTSVPWQFKGAPSRASTDADLRGAIMDVGKGRVAMFSEAAMFTAQLIDGTPMGFNVREAAQNKQFLLNTLHWLSRTPTRGG